MEEEDAQLVWNFDDAETQLIFNLRIKFVDNLKDWNLEDCFWDIRLIKNEVMMIAKKSERETIKSKMDELEEKRKNYMENKEGKRVDFFLGLEEFYLTLNSIIKQHGLCFQEKADLRGL